MFIQGLISYIAANPGVQAQLGTQVVTKRGDKLSGVFPLLAPDGPTYPYVTVTQISGTNAESMVAMNRFTTARIRLSCYGSSYGQAKSLAEYVRQAFGSVGQYEGPLTDGTILQNARLIPPGEVDDFEGAGHGRIYATHLEFE